MQLKQLLNRVQQRFLPVTRYDEGNDTTVRTWFGHKKVYDFEGYIVSHTYKDRKHTITQTYFPGTLPKAMHKRVFNERYVDTHTGAVTDEVWYNLKGKKVAYASSAQAQSVLLLKNDTAQYVIDRKDFEKAVQPLLDMVQTRTLLVNYDLRDMSQKIDQNMAQVLHDTSLNHVAISKSPIVSIKPVEQTKQPVVPSIPVFKPIPVVNPAPVAEQATPVKPKLTLEQRKDRWEEQLIKRMEKHDALVALKAKVETAARMNPEKKAERLVSLNRRLLQNEKAQHILNSRLKAFAMAKDRDTLKQFKADGRSEYKQWQAEIKQANIDIKSGALSSEQIAQKKTELKEMRSFKKKALTDYRMATKDTKRTSIELRKLKSTKRQKAIFDLNMIVREKAMLEKAIATEMDIFKHADMSNRILALNAQKRALLHTFKAPASKKPATKTTSLADLKRAYQPLLPGFQNSKEAS